MIELLIIFFVMFGFSIVFLVGDLLIDWLYDDEPTKTAKRSTKRKSNTKKAS